LRTEGIANALLTSLDTGVLRYVRRTAPGQVVGLIVGAGTGNLASVDVDFYALSRRVAKPAVLRRIAALGRPVHIWGVETEQEIVAAILAGADDVIVGNPKLAVGIRAQLLEMSAYDIALLRIRYALGVQ
jgi:glycerophosphoryl diester phosphodiesterase